ncbi:MAG: transposase domain-containing protein [Hyphomicrobiales bacterium]|nr:transposase domain-containing protein [Hyphomicrobiales bacterium]
MEISKLNGIDKQAWLSDVPSRIADRKIDTIDELLPWNYLADEAQFKCRRIVVSAERNVYNLRDTNTDASGD